MPAPLAIAIGAATVLGVVADGATLFSFFTNDTDDQLDDQSDALGAISTGLSVIRSQLNTIKDGIDDLQDLSNAQINQSIAQSLGSSQTALGALERYLAEDDAGVREDEASAAIDLSELGLNEIMSQTSAVMNDASRDSLMYAFTAIHYAMIVRQTVANVVQDGPLGSAGLHLQIKNAATFLYNEDNRESDLLFQIEDRVREDLIVSPAVDITPQIPPTLPVVVRSTQTDAQEVFLVERNFQFIVDYYLRYLSERDAAIERGVAIDIETLGIDVLFRIGERVHEQLAETSADVPTNHEFILTSGNDVQEGSALADYLSGRFGDDVLGGGDGPDAINGGAGNDILRGGANADFLSGGLGDDILYAQETAGQTGTTDVARFDGLSSEFEILGGTDYALVTGAEEGRDKLFGFQFLRFDDGVVELEEGSALDGAGAPEDFNIAERVALLYEAALNRDGAIDLPGLNFYIRVTKRDDLTDEFLANDLMNSPEFATNFGDPNTLSNEDFLEQIYLNVLDRPSDPGGRQFYLDFLNAGTITKALALADIAISPENTTESTEILMGLYENSLGEWSFL